MPSPSPTDPRQLADALKVLAEPNRLVILDLLMQGTQCNCELGKKLNLPPNLVSHHLNILRKHGWVDAARDAVDSRWVYYSINQQRLDELRAQLLIFLDLSRCRQRVPECGPKTP